MKRFLKQPGGADQYDLVNIEWIRGHNPDLIISDRRKGQLKSTTIDLSKYNYDELHTLFKKHFRLKTGRRLEEVAPDTEAAATAAALQNDALPQQPLRGRGGADDAVRRGARGLTEAAHSSAPAVAAYFGLAAALAALAYKTALSRRALDPELLHTQQAAPELTAAA